MKDLKKKPLSVFIMLLIWTSLVHANGQVQGCTEVTQQKHSTIHSLLFNEVMIKSQGIQCGDYALFFMILSDKNNEKTQQLNNMIIKFIPSEMVKIRHNFALAKELFNKQFKEFEYKFYAYKENIHFLNDKVLSFTYIIDSNAGGPYPNNEVHTAAFDLANGKRLEYEDLFLEDKSTALLGLIKKHFYQGREEGDYKFDLEEKIKIQNKWVMRDGFCLPEEFNVNDQGITLIYHEERHATGTPQITVSWQELAPYLNKERFAQYHLTEFMP